MPTELIAILGIVAMIVASIVIPNIINRSTKNRSKKNESYNILGMFCLENNSDVVLKLVEYHSENGIVKYKVGKYEDS